MNLKRTAWGILGCLCLLAGCPRPVQMDKRTHELEEPLSITLHTLLVGDNNAERPIIENETLHGSDGVYFQVRSSRAAYLYVVLFDPDGKPQVLFPKDPSKDQLIAAHCPLRIPSTGKLFLNGPAGREDVRVVASNEPLASADMKMCEELQLPCQVRDVAFAQPRPCPDDADRSLVSSIKVGTASGRGVAAVRMSFKHED